MGRGFNISYRSIHAFTHFMIVACLFFGASAARCDQPFPDVPKDHWAFKSIGELHEKGILIGYPNGTFNGIASNGLPKPKPAYDLSTPRNTFRSLLRAMTNGDEDGIRSILTKQCFEVDIPEYLSIVPSSFNHPAKITAYKTLALRWSKLPIIVDECLLNWQLTSKNRCETMLILDLPNDLFMRNWEFQMTRKGISWQITSIFISLE